MSVYPTAAGPSVSGYCVGGFKVKYFIYKALIDWESGSWSEEWTMSASMGFII